MAGAANPQMAAPAAPGGNVFNTAAGLYNQAAAGPNINQFMNPFTSQVIGRTGMDMARQAAMAQNTLGAQATRAGAFGGSRHGVAEGTMLGDYGRAFGDIAAQQRQAGFNTALSAAQAQQGIQSGLAGQGFGFGQQIGQQQMQQGTMQQALNQQLIDAARAQYAGFTGAPQQSLGLPMAAVGAGNMGQQTQTQTRKPGLFDFLSLGASVAGGFSDRRLKANIQPLGERNGVKLYSWDWNDEGKRLADPAQPTVGVIADELMQTHPHLVHRGADGYLRVDYSGLPI